jgi:hypothetical protein
MWGKSEIAASALLLSLVAATPALAKKPKPTPCPPDRYLLPAGISSLTGDSSSELVPFVLQSGQSSLGSCSLKSGNLKANKKGITTLVAKSPPHTTCNGFKKVLVRVTLPSSCQSATVKVKAKKFPLQTLHASRSFCGDGQIDAGRGEDCDGSGCPATATCDDNCKCQPIPTTTTPPTTVGTTSVTTTTTTSTTTTTLVGVCLDAMNQATAQACTTATQATACGTIAQTCIPLHCVGLQDNDPQKCCDPTTCPVDPTTCLPAACCGDGNRTVSPGATGSPFGTSSFGETCDLGSQNCSVGTALKDCASRCNSDCQLIGRCTGSFAACLKASECPAGQGCCGNGTVEAPETCDDGDFLDSGSCPASCIIKACAPVPASSFGTHVTYQGPSGVKIGGFAYSVNYPEDKVTGPTFTSPFGVSTSFNDLNFGFTASAITGNPTGLPSPVLSVTFLTCQGAPAATAADFTCEVTDASDTDGNVVDKSLLTCAVTVP